jgi:hypothetical protein
LGFLSEASKKTCKIHIRHPKWNYSGGHQVKKVLLTTIPRPLGVNKGNCTENIQAEMYHAQVTRAQGVFSIRTICTGWGLDFIAANLKAPVTLTSRR